MKRRELKRVVNTITESLISDCLATSLYGPEHLRQQAGNMLPNLLLMRRNYTSRISHVEPGMKAKAYFKDLKASLIKDLTALGDQLGQL
jgi:hypothetical protein